MNITLDLILILSIAIIYALIASFISRYCFRKFKGLLINGIISENEYKRIKSLTALYLIIIIFPTLFNYVEDAIKAILISNYSSNELLFYILSGVQQFFSVPLYYISGIILTYIAVLIFYRRYASPYKLINYDTGEDLKSSINKIFDSKEFYKAISTSLPKGNEDKDYGLDYIPYMLQSLLEKRDRFQKSSRNFLLTTICLSIFFIFTIISFSYILINESAIGIYRDLDRLSSEVNYSNRLLSTLRTDLSRDDYFLLSNSYNLNKLQSVHKYALDEQSKHFAYKIQDVIENFNSDGDVGKLYNDFIIYKDSLSSVRGSENEEYIDLLSSTINSIRNYLNFRDHAFSGLVASQATINNLVPEIRKTLNNPINNQSELIKRLLLSVVVVTFFLAVLRYFRSLYQSHYNEMLKAENTDLLIRKFYVTFKSSENDSETRRAVLTTFLVDTMKDTDGINKEELRNKTQKVESDILKDLLNAILKKI